MENKMSKEYVAELLKQLEELKRKKALKEKKLQKLKGRSVKDLRKGQASSRKIPDQKIINQAPTEHGTNQSTLEKNVSETNFLLKKDSRNLFTDSKCTASDFNQIQMYKDDYVCRSVNSLHFNGKVNEINKSVFEMGIQNSDASNDQQEESIASLTRAKNDSSLEESEVFKRDTCQTSIKTDFIKPDVICTERAREGFGSKKRKSSVFDDDDDDNSSSNAEKINSIIEKLKLDDNTTDGNDIGMNPAYVEDKNKSPAALDVVSFPALETIESFPDKKDKKDPMEIVSVPAPVTNSVVHVINSQDGQLSSHSSKKSSHSSKNKSPDMLDDSLNEKMSFLSSDLFDNNYNERKETSDNCTVIKNVECEKENASEVILPNLKPMLPTSSPTSSQQNIFNFPKFSTPTDVLYKSAPTDLYQFNKDSILSSAKPEELEVSSTVKSAFCFTENIEKTIETKDNVCSQNKFDTSHINYIIGKGLSSVLDAHYKSPEKIAPGNKLSDNANCDHSCHPDNTTGESALKKRKLSASNSSCFEPLLQIKEHDKFVSRLDSDIKSKDTECKPFENVTETDKQINDDYFDFDNTTFDSNSDSSGGLQSATEQASVFACDSCEEVPTQVTKTLDGLVMKVCESTSVVRNYTISSGEQDSNIASKNNIHMIDDNIKGESEIQVIPETEGLGLFSKDFEDFLETSTLSQNLKDLHADENALNVPSQSKLKSPITRHIVEAIKSSKTSLNCESENGNKLHNEVGNYNNICLPVRIPEQDRRNENISNDTISAFDNTLGLDTSFLEDDTQELGHFKQVPYMDEVKVQDTSTTEKIQGKTESNINFSCSLYGSSEQLVMDVEVIIFSGVKYAVIQHATQIHVWRQEKNKKWIKIFRHHIEDMLSLVKICVTMDDDNLVIVMLLSDDETFCLQFLLFEKDTRIIKLMENTHWLEERTSKDSFLLCGLNGLMFATAPNGENLEVSLHAFVSLKDNPRLMTAVLSPTGTSLCSLCRIDKLPNALMGISDSMLYVWHILEARLVTAVSLHPHDYLPIKDCFWATVENGLIYFLTTCEGKENHQVCQLLAANLATGYCQSATTYSTKPSNNKVLKIIKAAYLEPFLVVAHSNGAFIWSIMEEFCCAALSSNSNITTVAISKDFENFGLLVTGSKHGYINCYSIN